MLHKLAWEVLEQSLSLRFSPVHGADDLDTRLLRAMVIKGILEQITTANVNLVNADLLAKNRGLRIIESTVPAEGKVSTLDHTSILLNPPVIMHNNFLILFSRSSHATHNSAAVWATFSMIYS